MPSVSSLSYLDIEELEIKLNKAEKEKENELKKLKNNFSGFKEELIEQYNFLQPDLIYLKDL